MNVFGTGFLAPLVIFSSPFALLCLLLKLFSSSRCLARSVTKSQLRMFFQKSFGVMFTAYEAAVSPDDDMEDTFWTKFLSCWWPFSTLRATAAFSSLVASLSFLEGGSFDEDPSLACLALARAIASAAAGEGRLYDLCIPNIFWPSPDFGFLVVVSVVKSTTSSDDAVVVVAEVVADFRLVGRVCGLDCFLENVKPPALIVAGVFEDAAALRSADEVADVGASAGGAAPALLDRLRAAIEAASCFCFSRTFFSF